MALSASLMPLWLKGVWDLGCFFCKDCRLVDSHGQARGTKIYMLRMDNKRIHPRLKAWSSVWLASSGTRGVYTVVGSYTANVMSMKGRLSPVWRDGGDDASPGNRAGYTWKWF